MKTRELRQRLLPMLVALVVVAVAAATPSTFAAPATDEIQVTVTKTGTPGSVHLSWTGGNPGYSIHRLPNLPFDPAPSNSIGTTLGTSWNDSPPTFNTIFYLVSDTRCGPNDTPELAFVDANCDGIDGNIDAAIFVDTLSGNDSNPGTPASPKKSIGNAITLAAQGPIAAKSVYVSKGTYNEVVTIPPDTGIGIVSLYGGYDAANGWTRSLANTTTIASTFYARAILAQNLTTPVQVQLFTVTTPAPGAGLYGQSSTGVQVLNSPGPVTLRALTINSGAGSPGFPGAAGGNGTPGNNGGNASGNFGGSAGTSACQAQGGAGAPGVTGSTSGNGLRGSNGFTINGSGPGGIGGDGGSGGNCSGLSGGPGTSNVTPGGNGGPGVNGTFSVTPMGTMNSFGIYAPISGTSGLQNGFAGGGGGGGGSGGAAGYSSGFFCQNCNPLSSGGGGGGGGGGCGGGVGQGGMGGGGSFPVLSYNSSLTLDGCVLHAGTGGAGANGGDGGTGGIGGNGGNGAAGTSGSGCNTVSSGAGMFGLYGGTGGRGGAGAGGTGGPSICVLYKAQPGPTVSGTSCTTSTPAAPGQGGLGNGTAPPGLGGLTGVAIQAN